MCWGYLGYRWGEHVLNLGVRASRALGPPQQRPFMMHMLRDVVRGEAPCSEKGRGNQGGWQVPNAHCTGSRLQQCSWALGDRVLPQHCASGFPCHLHRCIFPPPPGPRMSPRPQSAVDKGLGGHCMLQSQAKAQAVSLHVYSTFSHILQSPAHIARVPHAQSGICTHEIHTRLNLSS